MDGFHWKTCLLYGAEEQRQALLGAPSKTPLQSLSLYTALSAASKLHVCGSLTVLSQGVGSHTVIRLRTLRAPFGLNWPVSFRRGLSYTSLLTPRHRGRRGRGGEQQWALGMRLSVKWLLKSFSPSEAPVNCALSQTPWNFSARRRNALSPHLLLSSHHHEMSLWNGQEFC